MSSTREKALIQEKLLERTMSYLGVQRTPNSGAGRKKKGDLQDDLSIFEAKTMMKEQQQYTIKKEEIETLEADRRRELKQFKFLMFDFGRTTTKDTYVVMSLIDFISLYDNYKHYNS